MRVVELHCVCLEEGEEEPTCQAKIGTSSWKIDSETLRSLCRTQEFVKCKRLITFITFTGASSILKVKTS